MTVTRRCRSLLVLAVAACTALAQTHYEGHFSMGGKAGFVLSRMQFNPTVPQTFLPGCTFGATFRYVEENHFALMAELNVEQRGWKEDFEGLDFAYTRRLTYVQLPLLTHIYFGSNRVHGFFNAGPELGVMIGSSTSSNFDYADAATVAGFASANRSIEQFTLPVHNRFDYGLTAGVGLEVFSRQRSSFTLEGRFYYGLADVLRNHKKDAFSSSSGMTIMVTLGYMYRL
ncbi:MAG: PorT family protein [Muribaculaceae bacterium]|nr:PorT family protein [Muribaculaceae bacterium]